MTNEPKAIDTDIIGGFPVISPCCNGCGEPLLVENAWMTDGCPCNHVLGVNSMNETRWRLLMQLEQRRQYELERLREENVERLKAKLTSYVSGVDSQHEEITRLTAKLAALRDGISEVVQVEGEKTGEFLLWPLCHMHVNDKNEMVRCSPAGEKLAKLWRESDPQETPKA